MHSPAGGVPPEVRRTASFQRWHTARSRASRRLAATVSAHHAHLFSAEITEAELDRLRSARDLPYGVATDSERTWAEVTTYGEIRAARLVDWATLGMLAEALG